jgi:hypothetical protein
MRGRAKGEQERMIILAHQIEAMAREKRLKPIAQYLKGDKKKPRSDAKDMIAMMKRIKAKGVNVST